MFEFYLWALLLSRKSFLLGAVLSVLLCDSSVLSVKADATTWAQTYDRDMSLDWAFSLVETADGGYAIAGYTNSSGADYDFWLVKTDGVGNVEWNQTYGGPTVEIGGSLVVTSDGGYALTGGWNCSAGGADFWLVKTDAAGNMEWNQTYGGANSEEAGSLVVTSDGGYAIAGAWDVVYDIDPVHGFSISNGDFWLVKTDAFGNMEWNRTYGGTDYDLAGSLVVTSDGGYALAGFTSSFGVGGGDFWLIKTDENGVAPVVPEASWVILPLFLTATLSILISKKKLLHPRS